MSVNTYTTCIYAGLLAFTLCILGCAKDCTTIPQPATTDGLSAAETKLDTLTDNRISKVAASVGVAREVAKTVETSEGRAIVAELGVAKSMLGMASESDYKKAQERIRMALKDDPKALVVYEDEKAKAQELLKQLQLANTNYEQEKAKKTAEFQAALTAKNLELEREKELRRIDADEARKDKFSYLGGLILLGGIGMFVFGSKKHGLMLIGCGVGTASLGYLWGSPYFGWAIGGILLIALIKVAMYVFSRKGNNVTPSSST